jgi:autotransporter-associated beta strand protein
MILAVAGALLCSAPAAVEAATCTWTGAGADALWSTTANWSGCSGGAPQDGDELVFPAAAARPVNQNDIAALSLLSIQIAGTGAGDVRYSISGTGVTLTTAAGLQFDAPDDSGGLGPAFLAPLTLGTSLTIANTAAGPADASVGAIVTNGFTVTFDVLTANIGEIVATGAITGAGGVTKNGPGVLRLTNTGNTFGNQNNPLTVNEGRLTTAADTVANNTLVVVAAGAAWTLLGSDSVGSIAGEGSIDLGFSWLTLGGGIPSEWFGGMSNNIQGPFFGRLIISLGDSVIFMQSGSGPASGTWLQSGYLLLASNGIGTLTISGGVLDINGSTKTINSLRTEFGGGRIELGPATLRVDQGQFGGVIRDNGEGGRLVKFGTSTFRLLPNTTIGYAAPTIVEAGVLVFDANQPAGAVQVTGGTLMGSGFAGPIDVQSGGIDPGPPDAGITAGIGTLSSGSVQLSPTSTFAVQMGRRIPPAVLNHDRLSVTGTVNLGNASLLLSAPVNAFLELPDAAIIINNDGVDPIVGTFAGLPEGAVAEFVFFPGGAIQQFRISYSGGDGNDVELALVAAVPCTWTGANSSPNWSVDDNWTNCDDRNPISGRSVVFPAGAVRAVGDNDLTDLSLTSIVIEGVAAGNVRYQLYGRGVTLTTPAGLRFSAADDALGRGPAFLAPIALAAPVSIVNAGNGTGAAAVANIALNGFTVTFDASGADIEALGTITGTGGIVKNGAASLLLSAPNSYTGATQVNAGRVIVNGAQPNSAIQVAGGVLGGSGTVGVIDATAGRINPGPIVSGSSTEVIGTLRSGSVTLAAASTLSIDLQAASHDQLAVTGTIALANAALTLSGNSSPDSAVIVDNDGDDPIVGTFAGLLEGALVGAGSGFYRISYTGGSGNDVELTRVTTFTYLLAEGATGSFFDYDLLIANPNTTAAPVTVTFFTRDGQTIVEPRTIAPQSRLTLRVDTIPGLEQTEASARVVSDNGLPLAVERTMFWDASGYGGHTAEAVNEPSAQWYFAEGSQGFFQTYLLVVNPSPSPADVTFTFLRENDAAVVKTFNVVGNGRFTLYAGDVPELVDRSFGVSVQATQPVVVERAMYFASAPGQTWLGGHGSIGVATPSRHWFFAEGATGSFFDTYILLANPATAPVDATITFLGPAGETFSTTKTVPAQGRFTLDMDFETAGHLPPGAVATVIDAPNELIAERSMYWGGDASPWGEAHNSFGMAQAGTHWGLAEGRLAGARQFSSYILLANSGTLPAEVQVTYLRETGAPIVRTHTVPPNSRFNIDAGADAPELNEASFGADVRVTNGVPITVERSMYWNANGVFWAGGSNAPATRLP